MKKRVLMVGIEPNPTKGYDVVVTNVNRQEIRPHVGLPLTDALTEAQDWADFFGVKMNTFVLDRRVVTAVSRGTYANDGEVALPTAEELMNNVNYRLPTHELNLNKIIHWEWDRFRRSEEFRSTIKDKDAFRNWLLPYLVECPVNREWLSENCLGTWMPVTGGVRFSITRDATLYKLFFFGK